MRWCMATYARERVEFIGVLLVEGPGCECEAFPLRLVW